MHGALAFGAPLAGQLSAPGADGTDRLIPAGWLSVDWQFLRPVAVELLVGFGVQLERSDVFGAKDDSFWSVALGARVRLLDDDEGYEVEAAGNLEGNLWLSSHIGYVGLDESEFGVDLAVGYEMSVIRPMQVGIFARGALVDGGGFSGLHFLLWGGVEVSFALAGGGDAPVHDADGDGVPDEEELSQGSNPRLRDSDQDGLGDELEVSGGTDPRNRDSDGDGITDGEEDRNRNGYRDLDETDPRRADTDGGGTPDGAERIALTDPLDARDDRPDHDRDGVADTTDRCPNTPPAVPVDRNGCPELPETIALEGVLFASGSAEFLDSSRPNLAKALLLLTQNPELRVEIAGHTDNRGAEWLNQRLSQYRAEAVRYWLIERGVDASRLEAKGYGSSEPVADNRTEEGRTQNRRIEFRRR